MIRTWDPQIRNLVLYPTELPGHSGFRACLVHFAVRPQTSPLMSALIAPGARRSKYYTYFELTALNGAAQRLHVTQCDMAAVYFNEPFAHEALEDTRQCLRLNCKMRGNSTLWRRQHDLG
jgi:hypothetical protein